MPTIDDVAREAGVGIGTVSRVLNGSPLVTEALRQRVLAVIERMGYQPSPVARAFGRRRTQIVEVLVPLAVGSFFLDVLRGIQEALGDTDYTMLLRTIDSAEDRDRVFEQCCSPGRADAALVLCTVPTDRLFERISNQHFPVVFLNVLDPRFSCVAVDHDAAARGAVEYCVRLGHRRIGLVDRAADLFDPATPGICGVGYREAMADAGLSPPGDYEQKAVLSQDGGAAALKAMSTLPDPPTAIIAASERQAIGVFQAARDKGLRIPGDLSIVGYSDSVYAEYLGVTVIDVPIREIGRVATRVLLVALADPSAAPQTLVLPTELLVRRTCGPPSIR